ncbi:MAG: hypothetical protein MJ086_01450 [Lachnospiraceae bacterium]|nr:hypothetical protein [Lachnospiraceae bacterium]
MNSLIKFGAKQLISGKVNAMEKKFEEFVQLSKLNELLKKEQKKEKCNKVVKVLLFCAIGVVALAGVGYAVYKLFGKKTDDYDLYDDLDNYYVEDDEYDVPADVTENDFAE